MTEAQEPNWPNAPKTLIDAWFFTVPLLYVSAFIYAAAFSGKIPGFRVFPGFVTHVAFMMSLGGSMVTSLLCLDVVSREADLPRFQKVMWGLLLFIIPPVACPAYYFMRMRGALFDLNAPPLEDLPKFVAGFIHFFMVGLALHFVGLPLMALLQVLWGEPLVEPYGGTQAAWFCLVITSAFSGALWYLLAATILCVHHVFSASGSRAARIAWNLLLVGLPPIGVPWFYLRRLRPKLGGMVHLKKSLLWRPLMWRKDRHRQ